MRARQPLLVMLGASLSACMPAPRANSAELALAAAASDSLTVALADSVVPSGYTVGQAGIAVESLNACKDDVDSHSWESFASNIVDVQLPPGFTAASPGGDVARWTGPIGSMYASLHRGGPHSGSMNTITSECDVYISGAPAHIDLTTTSYSRGVHATIQVQNGPGIELDATARTVGGQAQFLHAIRYARISANWGRTDLPR